jgi:3-isopropylmalate dehydrogenase
MKIAVLPGDGVGPEVIAEAAKVLAVLGREGLAFETERASVGGAAYDATGDPLPGPTLELARKADAILFGAVGAPRYDALAREKRPEQALLRLRKELNLFANLRPARVFPELADASTLRPGVVAGDIYFGQPRGIRELEDGTREGFDTMRYTDQEIRRIAHAGFRAALKRNRKLCSVDKANVLETSQLWREVVSDVGKEYAAVELTHMYVDNAAMQLLKNPRQFDVIVTGNMFGDILSDEASMLTGSIGMLPSASLDEKGKGLYEPIHGSAPDIAGKNLANPLAAILSAAMMLRYSFNQDRVATRVEVAVKKVLAQGYRTADIFQQGTRKVGTREMGDAVVAALY